MVSSGLFSGGPSGMSSGVSSGVSSEVSCWGVLGASMYNYYYELSQLLRLKWTHLNIYFVNIYEDVSLHIVLDTKK